MSCNGCRILRKGCSEDCILRQCIEWIDNPQGQANATVFVAKFFGRAGLMSFISSVTQSQRPLLFQSLLFEAVGRTVNPISGAVGLLWTGNWHVCQAAVMTVLRGGVLKPLLEFGVTGTLLGPELNNNVSECCSLIRPGDPHRHHHVGCSAGSKGKRVDDVPKCRQTDLDLRLTYRRPATPSVESETTTLGTGSRNTCGGEKRLLRLFV